MAEQESAAARAARLPDQASVLEEAQFTSPTGKTYTILKTQEADPYEKPLAAEELAVAGAARLPAGDNFTGTDRRDAKLEIVGAHTEQFADLKALVGSLTPDAQMINHHPPLKRDEHFQRVQEEKRNVRVRAFLYAASREADNDFHFIVGSEPGSHPTYMNMELSGLPSAGNASFARIQATRNAYKTFVAGHLPGVGYHHYDPPIPIEVEGSLFFDITHAHGEHPGPKKIRPKTIWEVHPISKITFEP